MADDKENTVEYWKDRAEKAERKLAAAQPDPVVEGKRLREQGLAQARKRGFIK